VIGVRLIDGTGRLVSGGGKVVKNAAGFDLPKVMVGSRGRLGIITQLSFKVFPRPRATITHRYELGGIDAALAATGHLCRGPVTLDAVDVESDGTLAIRLGGDADVLVARSERLERQVGVAEVLAGELDRLYWAEAAAFSWVPKGHTIVRAPLSPSLVRGLSDVLSAAGAPARYSLAGNVAWIAWPADHAIDELAASLAALGLSGAALTGPPVSGVFGAHSGGGAFGERIRLAFDPFHRFMDD
jgi:glycolate oxidase FAD binding subunit